MTAEERAAKLIDRWNSTPAFVRPRRNPDGTRDLHLTPDIAAAIREAEDAALERAAVAAVGDCSCDRCYGIGERIRALKAQQLPKKEG